MPANPGFQLSLDVKGRVCVVMGGDEEAADKVNRLLEAGAKVTVVSPTLNDALRKLTASAKVIHRGRLFRSTDLEGASLVINTVRGDPDQSKLLYELATKERVLLCTTDQPRYSTVMLPALASRGHLRCAISTSGGATRSSAVTLSMEYSMESATASKNQAKLSVSQSMKRADQPPIGILWLAICWVSQSIFHPPLEL